MPTPIDHDAVLLNIFLARRSLVLLVETWSRTDHGRNFFTKETSHASFERRTPSGRHVSMRELPNGNSRDQGL
jgi:hypothetical protein